MISREVDFNWTPPLIELFATSPLATCACYGAKRALGCSINHLFNIRLPNRVTILPERGMHICAFQVFYDPFPENGFIVEDNGIHNPHKNIYGR